MSAHSSRRRSRLTLVLLAATVLAINTAGCGLLNRNPAERGSSVITPEQATFGPCLPMYGSEVLSASMGSDGSRVVFVSAHRPESEESSSWTSDDRALELMEYAAEGQPTVRVIALSWEAKDEIPVYATPGGSQNVSALPMPEKMVDVQLAETGDNFVVSVSRNGVYGRYAKLYWGAVPAAAGTLLKPEEGLTFIPMNDYQGTEGIISYSLSPDGTKVAAVVGTQGEIRVYDLANAQLTVYDTAKNGEAVVRHDLPPAQTSINQERQPAVASTGTMYLDWSPSGDRLAVGMSLQVGNTALVVMDVASGKTTVVHSFTDSTTPQVAWASDAQSVFVMTTKLSAPQIFGDTEIRRLAAAADGREVSQGGKLARPLGYRGEPGAVASFGDDEHFTFVWEAQLWRLDMPGGVPAQATYVPLTPATFRVEYVPASLSLDKERAVFVAVTDSDTLVGERSYALDDDCPITSTVGTSAPTEETAEATGAAGATAVAPATGAVSETPAATSGTPAAATAESTAPAETTAAATAPATEAPATGTAVVPPSGTGTAKP